jgi:hypothetical protein
VNCTPTYRTWHYDMNLFGAVYPLRYYTPSFGTLASVGTVREILDLPTSIAARETAVHEAGHVVAALAHGIQPARVDGTRAHLGHLSGFTQDALACSMGAGERAVDRWLRSLDLWTPIRAAAVECSAYADRTTFRQHLDVHDYLEVHDYADEVLDRHWDAVMAVAEALAVTPALTGEQITTIAGLTA